MTTRVHLSFDILEMDCRDSKFSKELSEEGILVGAGATQAVHTFKARQSKGFKIVDRSAVGMGLAVNGTGDRKDFLLTGPLALL